MKGYNDKKKKRSLKRWNRLKEKDGKRVRIRRKWLEEDSERESYTKERKEGKKCRENMSRR